ncbi:hypothetical protein Hoch_5468 [Haliangium ochraceum DSM 14365]|uniref:Uncharacterized protein n=2 Tax=Haliangium ochraceum TaxID=80816 RepID=D0LZH2_HALO1|nr:hypothetical protein Hoch_5468 [Haliangium ochraceum DSM 14365]
MSELLLSCGASDFTGAAITLGTLISVRAAPSVEWRRNEKIGGLAFPDMPGLLSE